MNDSDQYLLSLRATLADAKNSRQRRLVVLSGEPSWSTKLVQCFCENLVFNHAVWVGESAPSVFDVISAKQASQYLGRELDLLVYDTHCGLNPNALAAISGAVLGGSLLILLTPELDQWTDRVDPDYKRLLVYPFKLEQLSRRFIQLMKRSLLSDSSNIIIEENKGIQNANSIPLKILSTTSSLKTTTDSEYCLSQDQVDSVAAIIKVSTGHRRRPLVITSDRGRGKSSALGIAAAYLLKKKSLNIVVTAPRPGAVQPVFEHAGNILGVKAINNALNFQNAVIRFVAPDELLKQRPEADLVLVDEAAAIPAAMLEKMLKQYSRIVFSTTVHGYEGTGRGFAIRFKSSLDTITPQWTSLQMSEPVRWANYDPVEHWLLSALLLDNHHLPNFERSDILLQQCTVQKLDRDQLQSDRQMLHQLFSLLINAHYQTSPSDLRNLLDGPNVSVWVLTWNANIVAAALVTDEGGCFDQALTEAIWKGQRRPQGHLLPLTLAAHSGWQQAPGFSYRRIMRIAVNPTLVRMGLGHYLLKGVVQQSRQDNIDIVGSSFSATSDVMAFWRNAECVPVRVGLKKDTCSGVPSAVVLMALSDSAKAFVGSAHERFIEQFCFSSSSIFNDLHPRLVETLLATESARALNLHKQDWLEIDAFIHGYRQTDVCLLSLYKLVCYGFSRESIVAQLSEVERDLLIMKIFQRRENQYLCYELNLTGKKQLAEKLSGSVKQLVGCIQSE